MIDIDALKRDKRPQSAWVVHALIDRLEAAEKRTAKLEERCAVLTDSLRLAVRQNNHDMLMTAEELRSCEVTLEKTK